MKRYLFLCLLSLFLVGCPTTVNTPGVITDTGQLGGSTVIQQASNSETPATLKKASTNISIKHGEGDTIRVGSDNVDITTGANTTTVVDSTHIDASTGYSREDVSLKITAILGETKYVQYIGIALMIGGVVAVAFFRVPVQALYISGLGLGMVILQSQLANPVWSWLLVAGIIVVPGFWLYHLWSQRTGLRDITLAVEEFRELRPDAIKDLESCLSRIMNKPQKKLIRNIKSTIK